MICDTRLRFIILFAGRCHSSVSRMDPVADITRLLSSTEKKNSVKPDSQLCVVFRFVSNKYSIAIGHYFFGITS